MNMYPLDLHDLQSFTNMDCCNHSISDIFLDFVVDFFWKRMIRWHPTWHPTVSPTSLVVCRLKRGTCQSAWAWKRYWLRFRKTKKWDFLCIKNVFFCWMESNGNGIFYEFLLMSLCWGILFLTCPHFWRRNMKYHITYPSPILGIHWFLQVHTLWLLRNIDEASKILIINLVTKSFATQYVLRIFPSK